MFFRAADDVGALVAEIGSTLVKAGHAGDDAPKCVFPSVRSSPFVVATAGFAGGDDPTLRGRVGLVERVC